MDLYLLDSNFLKTDPIDEFTSAIWTERYNAYGDITLTFPELSDLARILVEGVFVGLDESEEVMLIENVSSEDGIVTATGPTLTAFLLQRMLRNQWQTTADSWSLTGAAGAIAGQIVGAMCVAGGIMSGSAVVPVGAPEVIPHLTLGSQASGTSIAVAVPYGNVYDGVKTVCDLDDVGFKMYPPSQMDGTGNLIFVTYRGLDRTSDQSTNTPVIFEPALDSFTDIKSVRSISGYKNVAYAWANGMTSQSQLGSAVSPGPTPTGFGRRTIMVDASDVNASDYTTANLVLVLNQRAKDALANNNYVRMTDGQLVPQNMFKFGTDYGLGDVIELRGDSDEAQDARITEYIRSKDSTGETAYPTLSVLS